MYVGVNLAGVDVTLSLEHPGVGRAGGRAGRRAIRHVRAAAPDRRPTEALSRHVAVSPAGARRVAVFLGPWAFGYLSWVSCTLCLLSPDRTRVYHSVVFRVVRNVVWNRPLIGLDRRCTRLELFGHVVVRDIWFGKVGESHGGAFEERGL